MVNTAELRQIFPLRENTLRHVVEGDGRYPRAMTPSEHIPVDSELRYKYHSIASTQRGMGGKSMCQVIIRTTPDGMA